MAKIKILTDSACDIPKELEEELSIQIIPFPVAVDGKSYLERVDFTNEEFYSILDTSERIPSTAHITNVQFVEIYEQVLSEGYTDLIYTAINATGSNTYQAALMAKEMFYNEHPEASEKLRIWVVDSGNYSIAYGYPVVEAARKAERGASAEEIVAYLEDWFASVIIYFAPYSLKYVKKSGRVSCAAAFVGEMIGLKPIISIIDGETQIVEKVRGDKSIIPALLKHAAKAMVPQTPYAIVGGTLPDRTAELIETAAKQFGYEPAVSFQVGAAISINAGPQVVGIAIKGQKRR